MRIFPAIWLSVVGAAAMAAAIASCRAATEVTLDISTNGPCSDLSGVVVIVGVDPSDVETRAAQGFVAAQTNACDPATRHIGTLVVTPGDPERASVIVLAGYKGQDPTTCRPPAYTGCVVARRRFTFAAHSELDMPIELDESCVSVACDAFSTCRNGECFSSDTACSGESCPQPGELADGGTNDDASVIPDANQADGPLVRPDGAVLQTDGGSVPYCNNDQPDLSELHCYQAAPTTGDIACMGLNTYCCSTDAVCATNVAPPCGVTQLLCCQNADCPSNLCSPWRIGGPLDEGNNSRPGTCAASADAGSEF